MDKFDDIFHNPWDGDAKVIAITAIISMIKIISRNKVK